MKPDGYSSGDYAGITTKYFSAYYGYEETDENGDWCFVANFNDIVVKIPSSKLQIHDSFDCQACLLKGIAWLLMKYQLTATSSPKE